jgi:HKD family nuclease
MASKNYLKLLKEFEELKGYEIIIFTTYSFDPIFFDHSILKAIRQNNSDAAILILVDLKSYQSAMDEFTDATGKEYSLLPIPEGYVFHPKLFIFYSKENGIAYIGSHNLTLTGITHNLELSCKISDRFILFKGLEFINALLLKYLDEENIWVKKLQEILKGVTRINKGDEDIYLIHNLDSPILDQTIKIIKSKVKNIDELLIISPFFSKEDILIEQLKNSLDVKNVIVCIQKYNHNLNVDKIKHLPYVRIKEVDLPQRRRMHSKLIVFKKDNRIFVLMGSPNFTDVALAKTSGEGNLEAALFMERHDKLVFLEELKIKDISFNEVRNTVRKSVPPDDRPKNEVILIMGYVDISKRLILEVCSNFRSQEVIVCVRFEDGQIKKYHEIIDSSKKTIELDLDREEFPDLVWIDKNGKTISNQLRIYNPKEQYRAMVEAYSKDPMKISYALIRSKNLEELYNTLSMLFFEEKEHPRTSRKGIDYAPAPGIIQTHRSPEDILEFIKGLLVIHRCRPKETGALLRPSQGLQGSPKYERVPAQEEIERIFDKLAKAFGAKKLTQNNQLRMYTLFLVINIKILQFLKEFFNIEEKKNYLLLKTLRDLAHLINEYQFSSPESEEEFKQFFSVLSLIYYKLLPEPKFRRDVIIDDELIKTLSPLLKKYVLDLQEILKSKMFVNEATQILTSMNFQVDFEPRKYEAMIAYVVARIVNTELKLEKVEFAKKIIEQMISSRVDMDTLYLLQMLEELIRINEWLREYLRDYVEKQLNEKKPRPFAKNELSKLFALST